MVLHGVIRRSSNEESSIGLGIDVTVHLVAPWHARGTVWLLDALGIRGHALKQSVTANGLTEIGVTHQTLDGTSQSKEVHPLRAGTEEYNVSM